MCGVSRGSVLRSRTVPSLLRVWPLRIAQVNDVWFLIFGVAELVAPEVERQPEDEQVGLIEVGVRPLEDAEDRAVAGVEAGAFGAPLLQVPVDRLPVREVEGGAVEQREVLLHLADQADLVAVLQVPADARQIDPTRRPAAVERLAVLAAERARGGIAARDATRGARDRRCPRASAAAAC